MIRMIRNRSWQIIICTFASLLVSCDTNNSSPKPTATDTLPQNTVAAPVVDTTQKANSLTEAVIMVDSAHLGHQEAVFDSLAYLSYTIGQKRTTHLGEAAVSMKCTGQKEMDGIGDCNVFDFAIYYKHKSLLALKGIYGVWTPCFSTDTSWCSIAIDNEPGEFVSQKSLYVINTQSGQHYLVDTTLYDVVNTPIVNMRGKNFLLYINKDQLVGYDIATQQTRKLAAIAYKERRETATLTYRLSDISYAQELLTGKLAVSISGVTDDDPGQTFYSIPFSIRLKL